MGLLVDLLVEVLIHERVVAAIGGHFIADTGLSGVLASLVTTEELRVTVAEWTLLADEVPKDGLTHVEVGLLRPIQGL
jgi:propanediol dehydratase small subunit